MKNQYNHPDIVITELVTSDIISTSADNNVPYDPNW